MKNHFMRLSFGAIFFIFTACVSVQVPFGPVPKSDKAMVAKPNAPFTTIFTNTADEAWISEKTGNTISYLSECKKGEDKIEDVAFDAAKAIDKSRVIKSNSGSISSKRSSDLIVTGKVDNQNVKMSISVFRSGDCVFSLTYGGLDENFDAEENAFEDFKKGFRVP